MKLTVKKGRTSLLIKLFIQDTRYADGRGLTGLTSGSLSCYRARDDDGNNGGTPVGLTGATRGTWTSGGFVEKDSGTMPGIYEFGVPNALLAAGSETCVIQFKGANMAQTNVEIQLVGYDPQAAAVDANVVTIAGVAAMAQIRDAVFTGVIENGKTFAQMVRGMVAALFGKASGLDGTTPKYRDDADTKDRIVATADEYGNRSAVTTDLS